MTLTVVPMVAASVPNLAQVIGTSLQELDQLSLEDINTLLIASHATVSVLTIAHQYKTTRLPKTV